MTGRICSRCHKPFDEAHEFKACDACRKKVRDCRHAHPEKPREQRRKHYEANREKENEYCRQYKKANKERMRELWVVWYQKNREYVLERAKLRREANPEVFRERERKWEKANPEKAREKVRRWREANPDYFKKWKQTNRQKNNIYTHNRRARIRGNVGNLPYNAESILFEQQEGHCYLCGKPLFLRFDDPISIEHKVPVSRGGYNDISNVALAHLSCNLKKQTKTDKEYLEELKNGK